MLAIFMHWCWILAAVALNPRCQGLISLCDFSVQSFHLNSYTNISHSTTGIVIW